MNISELARAVGTTTDTLRHYEKVGLLEPPARLDNGYRSYDAEAIRRIQFVRSAQTLGFSLAEIREIIPQLLNGKFGRAEIEQRLSAKIGQIDAHIKELQSLRNELVATANSLSCPRDAPVTIASATKAPAIHKAKLHTDRRISARRSKRG
ncbi:heavy metal-responsive transcriptional regulator [Cupriavidus sp. YAF13]|uniref:heavy metal-responsive transcriptional regulator n=1 Tax=Cupriavidus sp. YAF13 TaxID=3233075 RepID=UPI003F908EFB